MNIGGLAGIAVGMVSLFVAVMVKVVRGASFYEEHRWWICAGLAVLGLVLMAAGFFNPARPRTNLDEDGVEVSSPVEESSPFPLANLAFWGVLFLLFGGVTAVVPPKTLVVRAAEIKPTNSMAKVASKAQTPPATPAAVPARTAPSPARALPPATNRLAALKLQGIVYDKVRPSAIINGRTYFAGDPMGDIRVVSIEQTKVVVELKDQSRTLHLGE